MNTPQTPIRAVRRTALILLIPALALCPLLLPAQAELPPAFEGRGSNAFIPITVEPVDAGPQVASPADDGIRLNFQGAALSDVLSYLSEAAGFVILVDQEVSGTVNVMSHQPLTNDEAVDLLNAILIEKGYVALRNGRILRIVPRADAHKRDLPVRTAARPTDIPRTDEMVTQIIPVRFGDAPKMIENLRPLLAADSTLSANESSNAIVMTDTQTNIRRMAEIIDALDTSIASISTIRVFPLEFADASQLAEVVRELFATDALSRIAGGGIPRAVMERFRMGGGRGGDAAGSSESEARQAASRVVAVSDERSNSLIVSAPDDLIPTIEELVEKVDTNIADITEVRIFRLENSDATELASLITTLYAEDTTTQTTGRGGQQQGFRPGQQRAAAATDPQRSQRALLQSRVLVVGDPRTNSLLVNAGRETMMQIAELVGRLDSGSDRKQRVYVHPLDHADVENVAGILRGMFESQTTGTRGTTRGQQTTTGRLGERAATGASSDTGATTTFGGGRATR